jgi:Flp pilus assembly pilin Flp
MIHCQRLLCALRSDRRAVTSLEYGLIASVMSVGLIAAMTSIRLKLIDAITNFNF